MNRSLRVAVLGSGIMGTSLALNLARAGSAVTVVDAATEPFSRASRWNEGKIHLGYLYAGDRSLDTARHVLPGGLAFRAAVEELIGTSMGPSIAMHDDLYLVHRSSVTGAGEMGAYFERVADTVRGHPQADQYLTDVSRSTIQPLSRGELESLADPETIAAGFRVPERSVATTWVADRLVEVLRAEAGIELSLGMRVVGVEPVDEAGSDRWRLRTASQLDSTGPDPDDRFDVVVNATWEGRLAVDQSVGMTTPGTWSHRYRVCLFVHTSHAVDVPSAVVATGPFGDVKNYNGRDFYISWYPAGLIAEGSAVLPPDVPSFDQAGQQDLQDRIVAGLGAVLPSVHEIMDAADTVVADGGWVFALGRGALSDPASGLHRRNHFGVRQIGTYFSVDTGKYSTAPLMARELSARISALG